MTAKVIPIQEWMTSFEEAAAEVAGHMMRFDAPAAPVEAPDRKPGAYISLLSERNSIHLGINSTPEGCRALARSFLGLRSDQPLEDAEVVDGVSEVMNIVAGKVKSKMAGRDGTLRLGLPMFLPNPASAGRGAETVSARIRFGQVECDLVVFRSRRAA